MAEMNLEGLNGIKLEFQSRYWPGERQTWDSPGEQPWWETWDHKIVIGNVEIDLPQKAWDEIVERNWDTIEAELENQ